MSPNVQAYLPSATVPPMEALFVVAKLDAPPPPPPPPTLSLLWSVTTVVVVVGAAGLAEVVRMMAALPPPASATLSPDAGPPMGVEVGGAPEPTPETETPSVSIMFLSRKVVWLEEERN